MPEIGPRSDAEIAKSLYANTRARKNGKRILLPEDLLEGAGDLSNVNQEGQPLDIDGNPLLTFIGPENADGWYPYLGTEAQGARGPTKQPASPLPIFRHSWMGNQPVIRGDLPPSDLAAVKLPRPEKPLLVAEAVGVEGYAGSTLSSPYFIAYTLARGGRHGLLSPPTLVPLVGNGQSIRLTLPETVPSGTTHIGVWLTEPGKSTSTTPGPFYLQREVDVSRYNPGVYELTGPYRTEKRSPVYNETALPPPVKPLLRFSGDGKASRPGTYQVLVVFTDASGEGAVSVPSQSVTIVPSSAYADDQGNPIAGYGGLVVFRTEGIADGATGWRPYVYVDGQWNAIYDSYRAWGNEVPYPLSVSSVSFTGWASASDTIFSANERVFLVSRDFPRLNTSGLETPTEALEAPVVFGQVRPPAGTYYAGITETLRDRESVLSETASTTISANQIPRIIRQDKVNRIPNGDHSELGSNGLPLDHTYVQTGGSILADGGDLVLKTSASTSGTTPSATTRQIEITPSDGGFIEFHMIAESPEVGIFQGSVETVLQEISSTGVVTETVLGSLSSPGETLVQATLLGP